MAVKEIIVVCAANLTGSSKCPLCCGKCWYGGKVPLHWIYADQGYVQYYPDRDAVEQEYEALSEKFAALNYAEKEKFLALKAWLLQHPLFKKGEHE